MVLLNLLCGVGNLWSACGHHEIRYTLCEEWESLCIIVCAVLLCSFIHSFIHSIGMCRMQQFLAVLRSFFHSSLLYTFSCHPSPPTILPSSLTSSCHLFLGLPLSLVVPKFIYNTLLGILFSSIHCTCPNQRPDRPWGTLSLHKMGTGSFPE